MQSGQARAIAIIQSMVAVALVPALWPLGFFAARTYFPNSVDPLLGNMEAVLYLPGLIWLLATLGITVGAAALFRLQRTNLLFVTVSIACAGLLSALVCGWTAVADSDTGFDAVSEAMNFLQVALFTSAVSLVTAAIFIAVGGFRVWKSSTPSRAIKPSSDGTTHDKRI